MCLKLLKIEEDYNVARKLSLWRPSKYEQRTQNFGTRYQSSQIINEFLNFKEYLYCFNQHCLIIIYIQHMYTNITLHISHPYISVNPNLSQSRSWRDVIVHHVSLPKSVIEQNVGMDMWGNDSIVKISFHNLLNDISYVCNIHSQYNDSKICTQTLFIVCIICCCYCSFSFFILHWLNRLW